MCLAAHLSEFLGWTPVNVKLLLPPRQSRENSRLIRTARYTYGKQFKSKYLKAEIYTFAGGVAPFCTYEGIAIRSVSHLECMAGTTGLEPATSAVTGQRSNQLSYVPSAISIT